MGKLGKKAGNIAKSAILKKRGKAGYTGESRKGFKGSTQYTGISLDPNAVTGGVPASPVALPKGRRGRVGPARTVLGGK